MENLDVWEYSNETMAARLFKDWVFNEITTGILVDFGGFECEKAKQRPNGVTTSA